METFTLVPEPLSPRAFAPFGEVIDAEAAKEVRLINEGTTQRFHALARIDLGGDEARAIVSVFRGQPRVLPFTLRLMERHPLGSQAFVPLGSRPWLAVVCEDPASPATFRAFACGPTQGLNYARGVWHHPLLALSAPSDFLVVDREGPGLNLEERPLEAMPFRLVLREEA